MCFTQGLSGMKKSRSLPPHYFEDMFAGSTDPWQLETSRYEQAKYAHTVRSLKGRNYENGFEIGCAGGTLTSQIAPLTLSLLSVDVSSIALAKAAKRCVLQRHVRFERMTFPRDAPQAERYDLIVLSEVAYYWDDADLQLAATELRRLLAPGGDLLMVHWIGETDYPQSGDDVVSKLHSALSDAVCVQTEERDVKYRLDIWQRRL
ncbi:hypothetical protein GJW-30_1_04422 [Variibacter gotjawalensis]|uniref:Uncharacterized protein n=2 Tax=Variibacter gotjawalensis TaxID=1333996 RepID=A0A0S3Q101_9BRAD|nr:nodulation protein S (NodS) [Variibacter gotjawalensis]BAT61860.1 hypothetical protein GJW-30_1_04422 [Variibacter gotjawalensis]